MNKECDKKRVCPKADSNYASDRNANTMYELGLFRESLGFTPVPEATPYRRPELKPMRQGQEYSVQN